MTLRLGIGGAALATALRLEAGGAVLATALRLGVAVLPWSPLARGRLTRDWNETSERQDSDVFGKKGRSWLAEAPMGAAEGEAMQEYLALLVGGPGLGRPGRRRRSW